MDATQLQAMAASPSRFREMIRIDTDDGLRPFASIMDDWQRADFAKLDDGWRRAIGQPVDNAISRGFLERGRGHSKTSDLSIQVAWALFASRRPLAGAAVAVDKDQSQLLIGAIRRLIQSNPWLSKFLVIQSYKVLNPHTGSCLDVLASDAPSAFGLLLDFAAIDELSHHKSRDMFDAIFSAVAKKKTAMLTVITNAGFSEGGTSWTWRLREQARQDPSWYFHRLDGPQASWISGELLAEQARILPPLVYARLWGNQWTAGGGDALSEADIAACVKPNTGETGPRADHFYVGGLDLGVKNDRSSLVVVGCNPETQKFHIASVETWAPPKAGGQISLSEVKDACITAWCRYNMSLVSDPWNAALLLEELGSHGVPCYVRHFVPQQLDAMARTLLQLFHNRQIELRESDEMLIRDLSKLLIVEKNFGYKLEAPRDSSGHADTAMALAIALPTCVQWAKDALVPADLPDEPD